MKRFFATIFAPLMLLYAAPVFAATGVSFQGPSSLHTGQTFTVTVSLNKAADVDTVRLNGQFSKDTLTWIGASPAGTFQNVSPGTASDQKAGTFSFGTYTLGQAVNGSAPVAVFTFRATKAGAAWIKLTPTSRVLSAGIDQGGAYGSYSANVTGEALVPEQPVPLPPTAPSSSTAVRLFSPTQPDPNAWYREGVIKVQWQAVGKTPTAAFVGFDQIPVGPAETPTTSHDLVFTASKDGVWYVHLLLTFKDGTSDREDLRIQIDRSAPHRIVPVVDQDKISQGIANFVRYGTTDDTSGIATYNVYIDGTLVASTLLQAYSLANLSPGWHTAKIVAFDKAGNSVEGETKFQILPIPGKGQIVVPALSWKLPVLGGIIFLIVILLLLRRKNKK